VKISQELFDQVEAAAIRLSIPKSSLARQALKDYLFFYCPEIADQQAHVIEPNEVNKQKRFRNKDRF
jgi:hypothetical protein